ncbi:hypothetical protein, partial [Lacticaseibacillus paracasei]|uniref:hypothetical protein n=1 Tax=Lacticaseibacillus paracasei TaxID=1597 RepID=UPI0019515C85
MDKIDHKVEAPGSDVHENHSALFASAYGTDLHAGESTAQKIGDYLKSKYDSVSSTLSPGLKAGEQMLENIYHAIADFQIVGV